MIRQIKAIITVGVVLVASLVLGACGTSLSQQSGSNNNARSIVDFNTIEQEYKDSVKKLTWPKDYTPPATLDGEDHGGSFQTGYGDSRASLYFECAWEREWLATYSTDNSRAQQALHELEKVPSMGYMSPQRADDATRNVFKDMLNRAKLGDPSGFEDNVKVNCPQ